MLFSPNYLSLISFTVRLIPDAKDSRLGGVIFSLSPITSLCYLLRFGFGNITFSSLLLFLRVSDF